MHGSRNWQGQATPLAPMKDPGSALSEQAVCKQYPWVAMAGYAALTWQACLSSRRRVKNRYSQTIQSWF